MVRNWVEYSMKLGLLDEQLFRDRKPQMGIQLRRLTVDMDRFVYTLLRLVTYRKLIQELWKG